MSHAEIADGVERVGRRLEDFGEPLTEHHLDGWRDAALLLLALGLPPMVPLAVSRRLWRRVERELVVLLARLWGAQ